MYGAIGELDNGPPDVVIASGPPFHVFIAGRWISKYFHAPLILDFRDEWSISEFDFVQKGNSDRYFEKLAISDSSAVVMTTASSMKAYAELYPDLFPRLKKVVIQNGWDETDFDKVVGDGLKKNEGKVLLSFVGYLGDHAPAHSFLRDLKDLLSSAPELASRVRVRFVGSKDLASKKQIDEFEFQSCVESISHVSKPEAIRFMRESTAVLLFNPKGLHRYLPGKIFDYIASGNPILLFGSGGEVGKIIDETGAGLVVEEGNIDSLKEAILSLSDGWAPENTEKQRSWLSDRTRKAMTKRFLELADSI